MRAGVAQVEPLPNFLGDGVFDPYGRTEGRGELAEILLWAGIIVEFGILGLSDALLYRAATDAADPKRLFAATLWITVVLGVTTLVRMPVDLFPKINLPVVVVATFYSGMPPEDIESNITGRYERFFTLAPGIDHMESRSLPGVSLIKVYFQPGQNPDTAARTIARMPARMASMMMALSETSGPKMSG